MQTQLYFYTSYPLVPLTFARALLPTVALGVLHNGVSIQSGGECSMLLVEIQHVQKKITSQGWP